MERFIILYKNSEAGFFRNKKIEIYYALEDGHVGRNM
jgi:hypothetical protein